MINSGPTATAIRVTDTLPAGVTFVTATPSQGGCSESAGIVTCLLGSVTAGAMPTITLVVRATSPGILINRVTAAAIEGPDRFPLNNESFEATSVLSPGLGDRVWLDSNGDGIQDAAEPGVPDVLVAVFSFTGMLQGATTTDSSGHYALDGLALNGGYYLKFFPPPGYALTAPHQGDDSLDSDVDPFTQATPLIGITSADSTAAWPDSR